MLHHDETPLICAFMCVVEGTMGDFERTAQCLFESPEKSFLKGNNLILTVICEVTAIFEDHN